MLYLLKTENGEYLKKSNTELDAIQDIELETGESVIEIDEIEMTPIA